MTNSKYRSDRRAFLKSLGATSSLFLPASVLAQARPCPPVLDGTSDTCLINAEADWEARVSDPGVVWAHDFREDAEVDTFRWVGGYGSDPAMLSEHGQYVRRQTADGITGGGCLEVLHPSNTGHSAFWKRPFSPFGGAGGGVMGAASDGLARFNDDRVPVQGASPDESSNWNLGNYAHPDYVDQGLAKDGSDFYLQFRMKLDPVILQPGFVDTGFGGKAFYISRTERSLTAQEIIMGMGSSTATRERPSPVKLVNFNRFLDYRAENSNLTRQGAIPEGVTQPGSEIWPSVASLPYGEWFTFLIHITPGRENDDQSGDFFDTGIEVWFARPGATGYTKIWDFKEYGFDFSNAWGATNGWNAFWSSWHNSWVGGGTEHWIRYDQMILSQDFIACPTV